MVMSVSDYVVVSIPLVKDTEHIIDANTLKHSKQGQILVNVGRGKLIDEDALVTALRSDDHALKGAALDVFSVEPLPLDSPLWSINNLCISPHNADNTRDSYHKSVQQFTENCSRYISNQSLLYVVNKNLGY